jgi:hypothetical protein
VLNDRRQLEIVDAYARRGDVEQTVTLPERGEVHRAGARLEGHHLRT